MSAAPVQPLVAVRQANRLRGELRMPPDKSITHRALLLAAMAEGTSRISDASDALDPCSTVVCLRALGVDVEREGDRAPGAVELIVRSSGWLDWRAPGAMLDCGNSGTTLRLLAGLLAGVPLAVTLDGDASLRARPVRRVVEPLRAMGARLRARQDDSLPPLHIAGRRPLRAIDWTTSVPSAQVKSAILLAGLAAEGVTRVRETVPTRDHTERMLRARGVAVTAEPGGGGSWTVSVAGGQVVQRRDEQIPGDTSAAAFWLVAGAAHPDAELTLLGVGVNPSRRAVIDLLRTMGARIEERPASRSQNRSAATGALDEVETGEPAADLTVRTSRLEGVEIGPQDVARAIDEIPILCLAAACARGTSRLRGAGELRHKESDRLVGIVEGLRALGARAELEGDDVTIHGGAARPGFGLHGAALHAHADHRLAMTFAVGGLLARGSTTVDGAAAAAVSYPTFFTDLERVSA